MEEKKKQHINTFYCTSNSNELIAPMYRKVPITVFAIHVQKKFACQQEYDRQDCSSIQHLPTEITHFGLFTSFTVLFFFFSLLFLSLVLILPVYQRCISSCDVCFFLFFVRLLLFFFFIYILPANTLIIILRSFYILTHR